MVTVKCRDFNIEHILECGQCFRYHRLDDKDYLLVASGKLLRVKQAPEIDFYCERMEYDEIWREYFDMDRDYHGLKVSLSHMDDHLKAAVNDKYGIRILKQDPFETLISFIISQNKHISHIRKLVETLSQEYGKYIGEFEGRMYYAFPTADELAAATEKELRELKVGFRAPYIIDAVTKVMSCEVDLDAVYNMPVDEGRNMLKKIKGVGNKVADCVLLFAYSKYDVFPVDVWVKRIMELFYSEEISEAGGIDSFIHRYFGKQAGFAQQYLFYHVRDNN